MSPRECEISSIRVRVDIRLTLRDLVITHVDFLLPLKIAASRQCQGNNKHRDVKFQPAGAPWLAAVSKKPTQIPRVRGFKSCAAICRTLPDMHEILN